MCRLAIIALSVAVYLLARRVIAVERDIASTNAALADHVTESRKLIQANAALVRTVTRLLTPVRNTPNERTKRSAQC